MLYNFEYMNFPCDPLHVGDVRYFAFLENLDCDLLTGVDVSAQLDLSKGAFSDALAEYVLADLFLVGLQFDLFSKTVVNDVRFFAFVL
jgi:hypothetical protein